MIQTLSKNRRRFLAIGILLILVLAFFVLVLQPYNFYLNKSSEALDAVKFEQFNNLKLLRKRDYYIEQLGLIDDDFNRADAYLKSTRKSLAAAEIQDIFKRIADQSNAELISTQSAGDDNDVNDSVGLSARLKADIFALQALVYQLEAGSPSLVIKEMSVSRGGRAVFRFDDEESTTQTLDVRLVVYGYIDTDSEL